MGTVVELTPPAALPKDLPSQLRQLADDVENGKITEMIVAFVREDVYEFLWPSSLNYCLILSTLAQATATENMKVK